MPNMVETIVLNKEEYLKLYSELKKLRILKNILEDVLNCPGKRMFSIVSKTWNPVTGCKHYCIYCWARRLAETKLKNSERYRLGFVPRLNLEEFDKKFNEGELVFVTDMGDLFGDFIPDHWIEKVIMHIRKFPRTYFLFLTKNPQRYFDFIDKLPPNVILGATIETDKGDLYERYNISRAPLPSERYRAMRELEWDKKFISIEPILDFDLDTFTKWIEDINPIITYVGYDNYNNRLPEPPLEKTLSLIRSLSQVTFVVKKTIRPAWYEGLGKYVKPRKMIIIQNGSSKEDPLCKFYKMLRKEKIQIIQGGIRRRVSLLELADILYNLVIKNKGKEEEIIFYTENPGTIFKLFFLMEYLEFPYAKIIRGLKRSLKEKYGHAEILYIDPFAGSGLTGVRLSNRKILLPGSAILPLIAQHKVLQGALFDKIFLCEINEKRALILRELVKKLITLLGKEKYNYAIKTITDVLVSKELKEIMYDFDRRYIVICKLDANKLVKTLVNIIRERDRTSRVGMHCLIFLDPDGPTDLEAQALKELCQLPGDIFMLLHSTIFARKIKMWLKSESMRRKIIKALALSEKELDALKSMKSKELEEFYIKHIKEIMKESKIFVLRDITREVMLIPLRTKKECYYLAFSVRKDFVDELRRKRAMKEKIPEKLQWLSYVESMIDLFSKVSNIRERIIDMLEDKYITLFGKPCGKTLLNYMQATKKRTYEF